MNDLGVLYVVSLDFLDKDQLAPQSTLHLFSSNHHLSHSCNPVLFISFLTKNPQHHHKEQFFLVQTQLPLKKIKIWLLSKHKVRLRQGLCD